VTPGLLIVDDDLHVARSLVRALRSEDYPLFAAAGGDQGLELVARHEIGVVISDRMMPEMDGIGFLERVRGQSPDTVRILLTGNGSLESAMDAIERAQLFGYLLKPWSCQELRATVARGFDHYRLIRQNRALVEVTEHQNRRLSELNVNLESLVRERTRELEQTVRCGILMLAKAAEAKDDQTGGHVHRIQQLAESICIGLGMTTEEAEAIGLAAIPHDVGKIHVPDHILRKPDRLSADEWEIMKAHTRTGAAILGNHPRFRTAGEIARSHHERWDGRGYPDGLAGADIPEAARIVAVADVFDALVSRRPYKDAWPIARALAEIECLAGSAFDPAVARAFLAVQRSAKE
jgi:response regulator RpfG family c-di-GMP phosphodiesterase